MVPTSVPRDLVIEIGQSSGFGLSFDNKANDNKRQRPQLESVSAEFLYFLAHVVQWGAFFNKASVNQRQRHFIVLAAV